MTLVSRAVVVVIVYLGVVVSPLAFAAIGASQPDHDFWTNFSVALGFTGLAMMGLEFALVARLRAVAVPFGQDALLQFHRQIGYVGLVFILTHFAISAHWRDVTPAKALAAPLLVWFGMAAMLALIVLVATSVWRRPLRLSYEAWHAIHAVLAVVLVVGAVGHIVFVDEYVSSLWKQILWALMSAAFVGLLIWVGWSSRCGARPWTVSSVGAEPGETTAVALTPPVGTEFPSSRGSLRGSPSAAPRSRSPSIRSRSPRAPSAARPRSRSRRWATSPPPSARSSLARASTSTARTAPSRSIKTRDRASG